MSNIEHPSILIDLGHVGDHGLPVLPDAWFQQELELCREWGLKLRCKENRVGLEFDAEQLVPYWIQKETPALAWNFLSVKGFFRTDSTNARALGLARHGAPSGTLVYAEEQTAGRGRNGREWFSPRGAGLYFSLIVRPGQPKNLWPLLTHAASVALAETLRDLSVPVPLNVEIKWPNDVLLSGRKCAGILLEMIASGAEEQAAIVGVGIDVRRGSVPEALSSEAVSIEEMAGGSVPRRLLLVKLLRQFQLRYMMFESGQHAELLETWKGLSSIWDGVPVWISEGSGRRKAVTAGINEMGALLVRFETGLLETLVAGDVSVRRAE